MRHSLLSLVAVLFLANPAFAQEPSSSWRAGVALSRTQVRFEPTYFVAGDPPQTFIDREAGWQGDVVAGWRQAITDRVSLGYQGLLTVSDNAWSLFVPEEPAHLEYSIPYTIAAIVAPAIRVAPGVGVFAEVGVGAGRVKELKSSPVMSSYDYDEMRAALIVGLGAAFTVTDRADLVVTYRHARYAGFEYDTFGPGGAALEHVEDIPRTHGVSFGFTVGF
ncbi:MAG: outer membrane protein [Vicinamibacterales bacterium]